MAGTIWPSILDGSKAKATDVNRLFDWLEGALMPQSAGNFTTGAYDLGDSTHRWTSVYFGTSIELNGMTLTTLVDGVTLDIDGFSMMYAKSARGTTANTGGSQQEIAQGTLSTPDFRAGAVTQINNTTNTAETAGNTIASVSFTTLGGQIVILAHGTLRMTASAFGDASAQIGLYRASANLSGTVVQRISANNARNDFPIAMMATESLAAGTYTFSMAYQINGGSFTSFADYGITVLEFRK